MYRFATLSEASIPMHLKWFPRRCGNTQWDIPSTEVTDGVNVIYSRLPLHVIYFVFRRNMWLIKPLDLELFASQISPFLNIFKACLACKYWEKVKTVKIVLLPITLHSPLPCIPEGLHLGFASQVSQKLRRNPSKLIHKAKSQGSPLGFCNAKKPNPDVFSFIKSGLYLWAAT